jgi:hypothetical protein
LYHAIQRRATQTLSWAEQHGVLISIAADKLTLGRVEMGLAGNIKQRGRATENDEPAASDLSVALRFLDEAVEAFRQAGTLDQLPRGLLARAECRRWIGDEAGAEADIREAEKLAIPGGMRLYLTDIHLLRARFEIPSNAALARQHLAQAKQLVRETGYHRRDCDIATLERHLGTGN